MEGKVQNVKPQETGTSHLAYIFHLGGLDYQGNLLLHNIKK